MKRNMNLNDIGRLLFFLFLILASCQDSTEEKASSGDVESISAEQAYFEDYVSPEYKWGFIDKDGDIVIDARYDAVGKFSEGLAPANEDGKWGYIDKDGKTIVDFRFKAAHPFREGIARVQDFGGEYHFINASGDYIEEMNFTQAGEFSNGLAKVLLANQWGYLDHAGGLAIEPEFDKAWDFEGGLARVKKDDAFGIIDKSGRFVLPCIYERVFDFSDGFARVVKEGKTHYASREGEILFGPFDRGTDFESGNAFVMKNGKVYRLEQSGDTIPVKIEGMPGGLRSLPVYLGELKWMVRAESGFALMDTSGELVTPFQYQQINRFQEGFAAYMRNDLWGYLDAGGNELIDPVFGLAWDFSDGLARAAFREGIAYVNRNMTAPFIPKYRDMQDFTEGLAAFQER